MKNKKIKAKEYVGEFIQSIEVRIDDKFLYPALDEISTLFGHIERKLYNEMFNEDQINLSYYGKICYRYCFEHKINRRFFKYIFSIVESTVKSGRTNFKNSIEDAKIVIHNLKEKIEKKTEYLNKNKGKLTKKKWQNNNRAIQQWKQKIDRLLQYIKTAKQSKAMFGTKELYEKQWTNEEYKNDHEAWLVEWRRKRNNHFGFVGSKDQSFGNQNCQLILDHLKVRVPYALEDKLGSYLNIPVKFHSNRLKKRYYNDIIEALTSKTVLTYRFFKRDNGYWYVTCIFTLNKNINQDINGAVGVDINYGL